ncbi:hypothetical protein L1987_25349 [Smallanthus sonchifolius]|uniref:Uncharacterized protein n=1 Tax=Smallanthus sonchifolius TaxID=185202 RepID=A0ACB9IMR8_9ASTR|nr:hypothetical protein L1987_25349 [Smallanthus sonchifolius]
MESEWYHHINRPKEAIGDPTFTRHRNLRCKKQQKTHNSTHSAYKQLTANIHTWAKDKRIEDEERVIKLSILEREREERER